MPDFEGTRDICAKKRKLHESAREYSFTDIEARALLVTALLSCSAIPTFTTENDTDTYPIGADIHHRSTTCPIIVDMITILNSVNV